MAKGLEAEPRGEAREIEPVRSKKEAETILANFKEEKPDQARFFFLFGNQRFVAHILGKKLAEAEYRNITIIDPVKRQEITKEEGEPIKFLTVLYQGGSLVEAVRVDPEPLATISDILGNSLIKQRDVLVVAPSLRPRQTEGTIETGIESFITGRRRTLENVSEEGARAVGLKGPSETLRLLPQAKEAALRRAAEIKSRLSRVH